ncbi:hypothetical protein E1B28_003445 [Marasmius oreades]|uniref:Uncharacterized protein n=1 Tax=Marasmius oreades TaxID=181124 RepID=A0A9P7RM85_9AGAR|nr:uncharacterized protein E1B28_003445 [Marasmius oreades]KAG7085912.1 hypothetical protein E1B28_003445 [Marasmius oreades]
MSQNQHVCPSFSLYPWCYWQRLTLTFKAQNPPVIGDPVLPLRLIHLFLNMHLNDDTLLRIAVGLSGPLQSLVHHMLIMLILQMVAFCLGFLASYLQMHRRFSGL